MREVDRRSKHSRRVFLQGAATAVPVVAAATSVGVNIENAWADDSSALEPATMKTLLKVARDIYPHDVLGDSYYITAIKPWDGKAAKDPTVKTLISDGIARLDQNSRDRHKLPYAEVPWEADRVVLLKEIEQSDFFQKVRGDLIVSLYNQKEVWPRFGYEGSSAEHGGYINRGSTGYRKLKSHPTVQEKRIWQNSI
ncbi:gluconate 2-dehydrogenase subunit 3 family protein [Bradyrhizobium sp. UFLA05-109]